MATTDFPVNSPLAVKLWSRKIAREALKETMLMKFMGTSSNNLCQVFDETSKGPGDKITVPLRLQLTGRGVGETDALEGSEEALSLYNDSVFINDLAHAVRVKTRIDSQRVPFSVREEARLGIQDWYSERIDRWGAYQLTGYTDQADTLYTGNQAATAPTTGTGGANRFILGDGNAGTLTEASISASQVFSLSVLDRCVNIAKTASPLIRPIKVGSQSYYVTFLHPDSVRDLRTSTNTGSWLDIQKAAMQGGEIAENPIFTGALGVYNGVVLHEWTRLPGDANTPISTNASVRRNVFCGAQALAFAWGQGYSEEPKYVEDYFDYERQLGVSVQTIAGCKKLVFNSKDFGTIVISSFATAP
jgi:N4-gp56 family major capsid protein